MILIGCFLNLGRSFPPLGVGENDNAATENNADSVYEFSAILDHRNTEINDEAVMEYLVEWYGYDSTFNSWVPEEDIKDCPLLRQYQKEHKLISGWYQFSLHFSISPVIPHNNIILRFFVYFLSGN